MNETFEANRSLFCGRFPDLAGLLGLDCKEGAAALAAAVPDSFRTETTRSGQPTLSVNGVLLHSRYNPMADAVRALADSKTFNERGCIFAGTGLAYLPELYARKFPDAPVVLVEPDIFIFTLTLSARPLADLLAHRNLVILIGTPAREVTAFLEKTTLEDLPVHESPPLTAPNRPWFDEFNALRNRNRQKREINANTLKRFGDLWLGNMCRNLSQLRDRTGISVFDSLFADMPTLVLAAGPSLDRILPALPALRRHCVIIAVDTAVRACVRSGVEPDFIVLVDPQYWNWRHLDGLSCPNSILVTESAAWPAVFRFPCRAIYLCSSLFPLGKYLESRTEEKGELGAGGSVSTTAWDFARRLGSRSIYMAGLDLGFPDKKTHFTGSIFEDRTHTVSGRLSPSETAGYLALYGAAPYPVPDYRGSTVLTDKRLILYAWWFESRLAAYPEHRTATLTPEGVRIPGFHVASTDEIITMPDIRKEIDARLAAVTAQTDAKRSPPAAKEKNERFDAALASLKGALEEMRSLAMKGMELCDSFASASSGADSAKLLGELDRLDLEIVNHPAKEVAAMVFTAGTEVSAAAAHFAEKADSAGNARKNDPNDSIEASRALYRGILAAADKNLHTLTKFS